MQGGGRHRRGLRPGAWDNARELFRGAAARRWRNGGTKGNQDGIQAYRRARRASTPSPARRGRGPRAWLTCGRDWRSRRCAAPGWPPSIWRWRPASAAVMGPSGSGKSLLLRQVADLDPGEGEVELDGAPRSGMAGYEWRRQVIYCQAEAGWWEERVAAHFDDAAAAVGLVERLGLAPENAGAGARAVHRRTPAPGPGARLGETAARAAAGTNPRRPWIRTPPRVSRPRSAAIWTKAARRCW